MNTRPPIIVVLGHVDHGKTTLLDYIRKTNIASKEAGQITQHIGAYQVTVDLSSRATEESRGTSKKNKEKILQQVQDNRAGETRTITFIDTPGHEAFSEMRSRGANVADLAVLVVAADDGVMPQTKEAIRHIKEAKIPVIVALNKTDLPGLNLEKIKKQLVKEDLLLEGYGGETVSLPISAKSGKGIKELLEMIILVSEMNKLKGEAKAPLEAIVIESKLDKSRGPVASVLVKNGTLRHGQAVAVENIKGKIRAMTDDKGQRLKEALPGTPVEILGLESVPMVGAILTEEDFQKKEETAAVAIQKKVHEEGLLKIILKADVVGTLEAIIASLAQEKIEFMESSTGDITESDIFLAKTTNAIVLGFNVKISPSVAKLAEAENVRVKTYQIIYELLDEIKDVLEALNNPVEEASLGKAEIIAEFPYNKGKVAGCKVTLGRLALGDKVKILRGEKEVGFAKIKSLRKQKEAVPKAELGQECGIILEPQLDFNLGDIVISQRQQ